MLNLKISRRKILVYFKIISKSEDITLFSKISWDPNSRHVRTFGQQNPFIEKPKDQLLFRMHIGYGLGFDFWVCDTDETPSSDKSNHEKWIIEKKVKFRIDLI